MSDFVHARTNTETKARRTHPFGNAPMAVVAFSRSRSHTHSQLVTRHKKPLDPY